MGKLIFVMIDGLRPDAMMQGYTPQLDHLCQRGSYTLSAQAVMPSVTLPCHISIFHSVPPTRHGVTTNIWSPMVRPIIGLIEHISNVHTAFFHSWEPLRNLNTPGTLSFSYYFYRKAPLLLNSQKICTTAIEYIQAEKPDFAFVYFDAVDLAGHDFGWMSSDYLQVVTEIDGLVGKLMEAVPPEYTVIVQSDHGGHERVHGLDIPEDMTIPWVIVGPDIKSNHMIQKNMRLLDTAPTIARILGFEAHPDWEGTCPVEIFT